MSDIIYFGPHFLLLLWSICVINQFLKVFIMDVFVHATQMFDVGQVLVLYLVHISHWGHVRLIVPGLVF